MKFIRKVTKNKIAPKDGSPAMEVVEFSMTDDMRESLGHRLKPYRQGKGDLAELPYIVEDHLPCEVVDEFRGFGRTKGSSTMYRIKKLPEISEDVIPPHLLAKEMEGELKRWLKKHSNSSYIMQGMAPLLGLEGNKLFTLARHGKLMPQGDVEGGNLHKHATDVDMLGGVIARNKAPTRFIDYQTMTEAVKEAPHDKDVWLKPACETLTGDVELKETLGEEAMNPKKLQRSLDVELVGIDAQQQKKLNRLAQQHSQELIIEPGDLVIWANDGRIFHQALPGNEAGTGLLRAVMGNSGYRK